MLARREGFEMYENLEPYPFKVKPPAKSSTSVMKASVCQKCGHKLDGAPGSISGSFGPDGKACKCFCHEGAK